MVGPTNLDTAALSAVGPQIIQLHARVIDMLSDLIRTPLSQTDAAIERVLSQLARLSDMDRAYLVRLRRTPEGERIDTTHIWHQNSGADGARASPDRLLPAVIPLLRARFDTDTPVEIPDVGALPPSAPEKRHLAAQGIQAMLALPMQAGGRCAGFIGFDSACPRAAFHSDTVQMFKTVADAVGNLLARVDAETEIAQTRDSLAAARNRLQATLDAVPDLILEVDSQGRYRSVHTSDPGQMMLPEDALLGRKDEDLMPPEIVALNRRAMSEALANGVSGPHPFDIETPRGRRRYALTVATRKSDKPGEAPGFVFISRDVTDEWRLQRERERMSLIAQHMTNLVLIADTKQRIEWINPAFEARTGWKLADLRGRRPQDVSRGRHTDALTSERIDRAIAALQPVREEILNYTRDGVPYWVDVQLYPLHACDGQHVGFVSIETDITDRKRQETALQRLAHDANEARARLEMAVEALPDAFAYYDADNRLVLCNQRHRDLYPAAEAGTCTKAPVALIPDGAGPQPTDAQATTHTRMAGGRWLRVIEHATPDGGRVAMELDITELKEAERRQADIIHGAQAGTWEWNLLTDTNLINPRWAEIIGYTPEEIAPADIHVWRRLVHPDDLAAAERELAKVFSREIDRFEYEKRMRHKAGHWVWVLSRGRVARWTPEGTPELMAGVHIDITALKRAEERLEQIIDAASAGIWEFDVLTGTQDVNDRWAEMLGYTRAELSVQPNFGFQSLMHPDDFALMEAQRDQSLSMGCETFGHEIRMRHRDGHWVWILSRGRVVARDEAGQALKVAGIHLDITERKRLESQLVVERDYLARLMDTSASGIAALDDKGRIIFANREAECILGRGVDSMQDMPWNLPDLQIQALDGGPFDLAALPFARAIAEKQIVRDVRFAIIRPDGTRRALSVNAAPITAEELQVRVVVSISDITAQAATEDELRVTAQQAEAANQAKSRFLANMSHEIRTPLNGVLGMVQILEDELSDPMHKRMLGIIRDSGETLLSILNDLLDMSKIEAGKLTLEKVAFAPSDIATRIETMHKLVAVGKGLEFDLCLGPDTHLLRSGDPNRLSQILHNLVGNAVKFTEKGSVKVALAISTDGQLDISVRDTGIGMSLEQQARMFEDFEQADGTVTRRFGGTGLGMSIVRRLIGLMGGQISVESALGQGTTVHVRLPLPRTTHCAEQEQAGAETSLQGMRVLVADDNATNMLILKSMLSSLGVEAVSVSDGRAAVEAWEPQRFDAVLLDISMPELDGISALARIRARAAAQGGPMTPALAISANAMTHQVAEYIAAGFSAHVAKPFKRADLQAALSAVIAARV
ncbi:PAS domain S-box-containing protein [Roseinatronobacter thiooxidans]|uniref:histidine kinase n=1 Tax=Roseinatronobacter thiooxidans TaxID=121821 RepID=A0A2W7QD79_9RHOB|nr:PAS domain S-box protein [Roseinatronobacter thiooxidans]PZX46113.1 PAS domain S-box-containing protein [Roseinatronobacter thiooxidans]